MQREAVAQREAEAQARRRWPRATAEAARKSISGAS